MEIELADVHLAILLITAVVILYADHLGFDYFRQKRLLIDRTQMRITHYAVLAGLFGMVVTGLFLMLPRWRFYLSEPVFYVKMAFVLILIFNATFIARMSHLASETPFSLLEPDERNAFMVSGALSAVGWIGAAFIGYFLL